MPSPHSANTATGSSLPPKENAQFKRILKCYEQKQYKNGLKFAKQILTNPKFAEHGETLAMKGLTLNCLGRKDEAYDYVRRGLRNDLKSHVCWHVYGLLQRSDKKYDEAIKCYRNALKWDKENIQILRDLSLLQIQMRDLEGYKETRYQLFQLRPTQRASWIGFAMSYHLLNDYDMTLKILEEFRKTQQKAAYDYEHSELLLYQNMVIQESGDISGALEHLMKYEPQICDQAHFLTTKGSLLLKLDRAGEAKAIFEELIQRNPENHESYKFLEQASGADTPAKKLAIYVKYRGFYPKAQAPQRLPLNYAEGQEFRDLVEPYLKKALRKGVPPLFVDLKPLYKNPDNCAILEEICTTYLKHMRANGTFDGKTREPPTALLWLLYYLSQHYDYKSDYATALQLIDEAIAHTPTLIELFLHKGKIYKHIDNREEAAYWMDEAQVMDRADRYINCKSAKYLLRANQVKEAEEMCKWFTRGGVPAMESLNEMQCMWFQTECAGAFERLGKYGEALKKCIEVDRHFTEIIEDQFDFHTYCMRKLTLRSYVDLLRLEDVLRSHPFYEKAAFCAIRVYLRLFDKPITDDDKLNEIDTENMDPSELKKLRNKQKKAKRKAELEAQEMQQLQARKELHNKSQKKNDDELDAPQKDELYPDKLERPEDPLGEALKFLEPLQLLAADRLSTHVLAFEIYFRKRKPLLMLQSIKRALNTPNTPPNDPQLHSCVIRFQKFVDENRQSFPAPVSQVLDRETQSIFADKSAVQRNRDFLSANDQSLNHVAVGAEMSVVLDGSEASQKAALKLIGELERFKTGVDIKTCSDIFHKLEEGVYGSVGVAGLDGFRQSCAQQFPLTILFNPELKKQSKTTTTSADPNEPKSGDNSSHEVPDSEP
ncbi:hypothetical protein TCAL_06697 [Tigriopus californicus]|uniref:N-alpha-acetyltransferase 15, NatA auxiliary subunit n=1 Tax=Tigriopus californicus TaxID=6832 RepID=A0A553P8K1_TIGCA|nr:N-alpha-acetyltransferase 16, NatA auxiliary subunit-like isoform X2 [Tigriopus californicus]TRY74013.1 hypothetical protein TCAL_06697 [Tigriopus californicus]|eukprot:TCALIF_06697-PA protein Name:"Similar to NAA16 N-alpha-acetyltransferase 16, NatA auxiliary subunit (Homo sapiens)" AED:0.05 eAED:0.05 QI:320/1/0.8/1/0.88/0.7/10/0/883